MIEQKEKRLSKILLALFAGGLATTLTVGCASSLETTANHLRAGRVDDALNLIEKVRLNDEGDPDAKSLEVEVRRRWISDKLIQVRLLRLGGNIEASATLLRDVVGRETRWSMMPTGAVFATQSEEIGHLATMIQGSIREALQRGLPLQAASNLYRDRELLEKTLKIDVGSLRLAIGSEMTKLCTSETRPLTKFDHFHFLFLEKTCRHFKVSFKKMDTQNSVRLFKRLTPQFELKGAPEASITEIGQDLVKEFEKSIWFDRDSPSSRDLVFVINGEISERFSERPVYRSKPFSVQIPIEERSIRKKEVRSGLGLLFEVLAWAIGAGLPSIREIDNMDGTVTVFETKYRTETRYHTYAAKEVTQTLDLNWNVHMNFLETRRPASSGKDDSFKFKDTYQLVSDEHDVRFPDAGLYPETRKTLHPIEWLKTVNRKLLDRVGNELNLAWISKFCDFQKEKVFLAESELHHRCAFGASERLPESTARWFEKRYGVEFETWRQMMTVPL